MVHTEVSKSSDARFRSQKVESKTGRRHFVREGRSDARFRSQKLASLTGRQHFVQDESSDARFQSQNLRRGLDGGTLCERGAVTQGFGAKSLRR